MYIECEGYGDVKRIETIGMYDMKNIILPYLAFFISHIHVHVNE